MPVAAGLLNEACPIILCKKLIASTYKSEMSTKEVKDYLKVIFSVAIGDNLAELGTKDDFGEYIEQEEECMYNDLKREFVKLFIDRVDEFAIARTVFPDESSETKLAWLWKQGIVCKYDGLSSPSNSISCLSPTGVIKLRELIHVVSYKELYDEYLKGHEDFVDNFRNFISYWLLTMDFVLFNNTDYPWMIEKTNF